MSLARERFDWRWGWGRGFAYGSSKLVQAEPVFPVSSTGLSGIDNEIILEMRTSYLILLLLSLGVQCKMAPFGLSSRDMFCGDCRCIVVFFITLSLTAICTERYRAKLPALKIVFIQCNRLPPD